MILQKRKTWVVDSNKGNNTDCINPLTSQREGVSVFAYPYLITGEFSPREAKGLINKIIMKKCINALEDQYNQFSSLKKQQFFLYIFHK